MSEVAATMSDVLGRPISYIDMPEDEFRSLLVQEAGVPEDVVDIQVLLHFAAWKRGDANLVTGTYRELTGQAPTSLADWVALNREAFEVPASEPDVAARSTT
jgi:NAD(P)H dehydrogenase (quinone)